MAAYSQSAGGRFAAQAPRSSKKYRQKLHPAAQWILAFLMMIVLFATYFVLCLLLTKYNLFAMSVTVRLALLLGLVVILLLLTLIMSLYGDWKRILCALLICLAVYIPLNYSRLPKLEQHRKWLIQTAYSTMRHQGLMHFYLPWICDDEIALYTGVLEEQIGNNTQDTFVNDGDDWMANPEQDSENWEELLREDPGLTELPADQQHFYAVFYELDRSSFEAYAAEHPEVLANGFEHILINKTSIQTAGTGIKTKSGDEVLAIDADNGILILELRVHDTRTDTYSRGVLAIGKDPSRLHLYPATTLPAYGQRAGVIAKNNGGVLAMTGSGFIDEGGVGNGGEIAGFARCDGKDYGTHMKWGSKRLELHENNWFYLKDAPTETSSDTTDCMEFQPAMVINGQAQDIGYWYDVNPRACIGQSSKGEILMLVVEGRGVGGSPGVSLKECVKVLMDHNCQTAMNCDGGTTAILWYRGEPIIRCSNTRTPEGRYLPNAWVYVGK